MHVEFLVEEPSAEAALQYLLPRILPAGTAFAIYPHQGKTDLLSKLPNRLRAYRAWLPQDWRIVVLIDRDTEDCEEIKQRLEHEARRAGLRTKSEAGSGPLQVLNRIAVEELEAWFLGDVEALVAAYPKMPPTLGQKAAYRDPDGITGGTGEALERALQKAGYFPAGLGKIEAARQIARNMEPARNRSRSFQCFRDGLVHLFA